MKPRGLQPATPRSLLARIIDSPDLVRTVVEGRVAWAVRVGPLALALGLLAGCSPGTEVVVTINSDELVAPTDLQKLCITVTNPAVGPTPVYKSQDLAVCPPGRDSNCFGFPISVTLTPGSERPEDTVRVEVLALPAGTSCSAPDAMTKAVTSDASVFTFVKGESQKLDFFLYRSCLDKQCARTDQACDANGSCVDVKPRPSGAPPDLATVPDGCPVPGPSPATDGGCSLYSFSSGLPDGVVLVDPLQVVTLTPECGMLHVHVAEGEHDFWRGNAAAPRLEIARDLDTPYRLATRFHGTFNQSEQLAGLYANVGAVFVGLVEGYIGGNAYEIWNGFDAAQAVTLFEERVDFAASPETHTMTMARSALTADVSTFSATGTTAAINQSGTQVAIPATQRTGVLVGNTGSAPNDIYLEYVLLCLQ